MASRGAGQVRLIKVTGKALNNFIAWLASAMREQLDIHNHKLTHNIID